MKILKYIEKLYLNKLLTSIYKRYKKLMGDISNSNKNVLQEISAIH